MTPRKYKITLDQLRMAAVRSLDLPSSVVHLLILYSFAYVCGFIFVHRLKSKYKNRSPNPCADHMERLLNSMEAANFNVRPMWKVVKELDQCLAENKYDPNKEKKSTMYYLNQYLDQQKHKTK